MDLVESALVPSQVIESTARKETFEVLIFLIDFHFFN